MKSMLASNYDEKKLLFPLGAEAKIDGVRGLNMNGALTGRSLKKFGNKFTTAFFSKPEYLGFDGELAAEDECHPRLCNLTTSAVTTHEGEPWVMWHVFDLLTPQTVGMPYQARHHWLTVRVNELKAQGLLKRVKVVPMQICNNLEELLYWDAVWLEMGYEGTIIRSLTAKHKEGRSTVREGGLLRIKRFVEEEAVVDEIVEGNRNDNEAQINELGKTFRTSHQENKVPNGQVGSMRCTILKDSDLFKAGDKITVSKGDMTEDQAIDYFLHPEKLLKHVITFKHFPKGVKNKPRFPTWKNTRHPADM